MIEIRQLKESDIAIMVEEFARIGWEKPASLFQNYLKDQIQGVRFVWVAFEDEKFVGYVTLKLNSEYASFKQQHIPEINDLNVLPEFRRKGIGSRLLDVVENKALSFNHILGIGVGLYADYGSAQRLYVKRGYIPDGKGVTYQYKSIVPGDSYHVDDDLILWFTKALVKV